VDSVFGEFGYNILGSIEEFVGKFRWEKREKSNRRGV
jgi:hypothetical protein